MQQPPRINWWSRVKAAFSRPEDMIHPPQTNWASVLLPRTKFNYQKEVGSGRGNSIVMAVAFWLMRNIPDAPLRVYDDQDVTVEEHELYALLRRPNDRYSGVLLWYATVLDFIINGNAYWLKVRSEAGHPVQLWYTPQNLLNPVWDKNGDDYITEYEYKPDPNGKPIKLEPSDVVHFRYGLDPSNIRKGLPPLGSLLREIFTDDEAANFTAALLRNLGVPGVIIVPRGDTKVDRAGAELIKAQFMQKFGGDKRGEPMVLSYDADVKNPSFSPKDLELTSLRRIPEERVTAVTGVPAVVVGLGAGLERSTFSNMQEARQIAYENGCMPIQTLFAAEIDVQLLPDFGGAEKLHTGFDTSKVRVLQEDLNALEERLGKGLGRGAIRRAEYREALGFEVTEADNVYLMPASVLEIPVGEAPVETRGREDVEVKQGRQTQQFIRASHQSNEKLTEKTTDAFIDWFLELSANISEAVRTELVQNSSVQVSSLVGAPSSNGHRQSRLKETVATTVGTDVDLNKVVPENLEAKWAEIYGNQYGDVANQVSHDLSEAYELDFLDAAALWAQVVFVGREQSSQVDIRQQTEEAIKEGLMLDGEPSISDIVRRIEELVAGKKMYPGVWQARYAKEIANGSSEALARGLATQSVARFRGAVIAKTEVRFAQNLSTLISFDAAGVKRFLTTDGDICGWLNHDDPDRANGKVVTIEQAIQYPLAHPHCQRQFLPILEASDQPFRRSWSSLTPQEKLARWRQLQKHLQGQHDQQSHGNRESLQNAVDIEDRYLKEFDDWAADLAPEYKNALIFYGEDGYVDVNQALRQKRGNDVVIRDYIADISAAINTHPGLSAPAVGYRGITSSEIAEKFRSGEYKVGMSFGDRAFVSTSMKKEIAEQFIEHGSQQTGQMGILFEVEIPAKAKVGTGIAYGTAEAEILLNQDANFRITNINSSDKWAVVVTAKYDAAGEIGEPDVYLGEPARKSLRRMARSKNNDIDPSRFDRYVWGGVIEEKGAKHLSGQHDQQSHGNRGGSYRTFDNEADAVAAYKKEMSAWVEKLPEKHREALFYYGDEGYEDINISLRRSLEIEAEDTEFIKNISAAIATHPGLSEGVVAYRGIAADDVAAKFESGELKPGMSFGDKAFVSTSLERGTAKAFLEHAAEGLEEQPVLFEVLLDPGTKVGTGISLGVTETELLLDQDANFVLRDVTKENGVLKVTAWYDSTGQIDEPDIYFGALEDVKSESIGNWRSKKKVDPSRASRYVWGGIAKNPKKSVKHLPGQHDQMTHGNRGGTRRKPAEYDQSLRDAYASDLENGFGGSGTLSATDEALQTMTDDYAGLIEERLGFEVSREHKVKGRENLISEDGAIAYVDPVTHEIFVDPTTPDAPDMEDYGSDVLSHTIVHELIHTRSKLPTDPETAMLVQPLEEGITDYLAQEVSELEGWDTNISPSYIAYVDGLKTIASVSEIDEHDFIHELAKVPQDEIHLQVLPTVNKLRVQGGLDPLSVAENDRIANNITGYFSIELTPEFEAPEPDADTIWGILQGEVYDPVEMEF